MCNQYTTGFNFGQSGCGYNACGYTTYGCGNGAWGRQFICRDCCGNIVVNQGCRNCCCGCQNACGCNGNNNGVANQNGNGQTGRFTCVTFCGVNNTATTTNCGGNTATANCGFNTTATANAGDLYYARQYGLYPFGYHRGCGCTLDAVSGT